MLDPVPPRSPERREGQAACHRLVRAPVSPLLPLHSPLPNCSPLSPGNNPEGITIFCPQLPGSLQDQVTMGPVFAGGLEWLKLQHPQLTPCHGPRFWFSLRDWHPSQLPRTQPLAGSPQEQSRLSLPVLSPSAGPWGSCEMSVSAPILAGMGPSTELGAAAGRSSLGR